MAAKPTDGGYVAMLDTDLLASIPGQKLANDKVEVNGNPVTVNRTSKHRLRTLAFTLDGREYQTIEQNVESQAAGSNWCERGIRLCNSRTQATHSGGVG